MPQITLSSGVSFEAKAGISLLDAGTQAQVSLPYSCKTGRCSSCKCKVSSGTTIALQTETGLTDAEKAEGWILSCVRTAESDVELEVEDLGGIVLPQAKTLPCRINSIKQLAADVVQVQLRLPPTSNFEFIPGQYIDVIGPNGVRRSYSLANAGISEKELELHIRQVDGGVMSDYWFNQAKPNDLLRLNGPLGTFFFRATANKDLIFMATGTGIAPVKALLESIPHLAPEVLPKSITVLWGGRKPEDLYFDASSLPGNFQYIPVLSRADASWTGAKGYIQDVLLTLKPDLANATVYACGSDAMIHSAKEALIKAGLPYKQFYSDAFVSSATN